MRIIVFFCLVATCLADSAEKRIVIGIPSVLLSHPFQASILVQSSDRWIHNCGGVLIAVNAILTSAHCLQGQTAFRMLAMVGALNLSEVPNAYEQTVRVSRYVIHESYNGSVKATSDDIGIIYLASGVTLNDNVQLAGLPNKGSFYANSQCVITGWGQTSGFGSSSATLMEANITKITTAECQSKWPDENINLKQICVYEDAGNRPSTCHSDSGGAMMCGDRKELLTGIASWVGPNCNGDYPSVYTLVSEYLDWIASK